MAGVFFAGDEGSSEGKKYLHGHKQTKTDTIECVCVAIHILTSEAVWSAKNRLQHKAVSHKFSCVTDFADDGDRNLTATIEGQPFPDVAQQKCLPSAQPRR